jgi:hypothetical protein
MAKVRKFSALNIRKITGGKDPVRLVEEFILRRGFDPDKCEQQRTADHVRWMMRLGNEEELEVLVEGLKVASETTVYMGVNVVTVPVRGGDDVLAAALQIADGLVGIKVSLVGHYLVLSSTLGAAGLTVDELDYNYKLISAQQTWFREALADELGWEGMPEE